MDINMQMFRHYCSQPKEAWYNSLADLRAAAFDMRQQSSTFKGNLGKLRAENIDGEIAVVGGSGKPIFPNGFAFGQLCSQLGGGAAYLRSKPTDLAVDCLNDDFKQYRHANNDERANKLLVTQNGRLDLRAVNGPDYGRVWNYEIADACQQIIDNAGGKQFIPPPTWPGSKGDKGGLWLNDRQVVLFHIDGGSIVDGGGDRDQLHRGFIMSNSEVGDGKVVFEAFYFRSVCGNLMIIGKQLVMEMRIIHRKHAAKHFKEALPSLTAFGHGAEREEQAVIRGAKRMELPFDPNHRGERQDDPKLLEFQPLLPFPKALRKAAIATAVEEEGKCDTLWDIVQGFTAEARKLPLAQDRFKASAEASKILNVIDITPRKMVAVA